MQTTNTSVISLCCLILNRIYIRQDDPVGVKRYHEMTCIRALVENEKSARSANK